MPALRLATPAPPPGQQLCPRHVSWVVRATRRQQPDLLLISTEDGQKVAGHRSLLCLFSPTFAAVLAGHDQGEAVLKVFLEVGSIGLFAFHRYTEKEIQINLEDMAKASPVSQICSKQSFGPFRSKL